VHAASALLVFVACRSKETQTISDSVAGMDSAPAAATPTPLPGRLTDAQIAHIAITANSVDSAAGEFALANVKNASVKEFARAMITEHGEANRKAKALATKLALVPEDNDASRALRSDADQARAALMGRSGADFDRAYIDHEVQAHQGVLDQLDQNLIPGAQDAELRSLLQAVRPMVAGHLDRAKRIQPTIATASQ
jgi:putative membrane protein